MQLKVIAMELDGNRVTFCERKQSELESTVSFPC